MPGEATMTMRRREFLMAGTAAAALPMAAGVPAFSQSQPRYQPPSNAPSAGEWRTYGGDLSSTRYAALDQINKDNFSTLEVAWRFKTDAFGPRPEINFETTPLMIDGVIYATVGTRRAVVALRSEEHTSELQSLRH